MNIALLLTDYYKDFACTGSACAYNCCQHWGINLSRADYSKIRAAKKSKELEERLRQGMKRRKDGDDKQYAYFTTGDDVCAMLREDGLCALQIECGGQTLPKTCRKFPRIVTLRKGATDCVLHACSAGCPEIMKELVLRERPLGFVSEEQAGFDASSVNVVVSAAKLPLARHSGAVLEVCIDTLQNRRMPLHERFIVLGLAIRALEELHQREKSDGPQEQAFSEWLAQYTALSTAQQGVTGIEPLACNKAFASNLLLTQRLSGIESVAPTTQNIFEGLGVRRETIAAQDDQPEQMCFDYEISTYERARQTLGAALDVEAMMENIVVNYAFQTCFPMTNENLWQEYLFLCQLYSYLRFAATACYAHHGSIDTMIVDLTRIYRLLAHSKERKEKICEFIHENDCSTLAHMVMLTSI